MIPNPPVTTPAPKGARPKFGFNAAMCLGYGLLLLVIFTLIFAVVLAKTGLVHIPLASQLYQGPKPVRIVTAGITDPEAWSDEMSLKIAVAVKRGGPPPYIVTLNETELTGALRGALAAAIQGNEVIAERPQVVITPSFVELSGRFARSNIAFDLLSRYEPRVEGGALVFNPVSFQFGDYPIATSTAQNVLGYLFKRDFGTWRMDAGEIGLRDIQLLDGKVELFLSP